ncbi:MAG: 2-C-methyl-D-erythritol 2,4-cyclodiphosphate synthase [Bacteroidota bacterium]|jgi:2-C-methyl-D-erythritol 2,4-cyclodiphosphate synthase|uniref:2-C-methyl-D-erythritol 2,4-cyclodiphosphate synthase n=1 Tax=Candidatus Pollutiaquabacter sp. TaxID=3416354 RepID=UPI001A639A23|nr:2-C-methyl-D-erythritol 2,4-cyclodiphosphate synthase [Bacteroidota bacterium]MBL7948931.1 2-C-methyl-D-erythritol 2,4-cyclodiphosphate synthase [Bacteroidia bacterium]HPD54564.1 2-C-methyl-D-erythritol 2,4-cyclodiphosphate synthase [Bacteroidia bacterium]HRI42085.1 2-C-methyl-D-erythritol 2,4-cyclodiphosphate synthase [Bacteroidia bacterium]HRU60319.1 2-C-methyl-D-erythritol 2,4-cyclodiphosphate synthase [Bacteroidia bacterium]
MRIGFGFDVHQLKEDHPFWLGGIHIPHTKGAFGHSDADVLIHAICDALLGAAALGDIGKHFPDTSTEFKNIDSKILLRRVRDLIDSKGWQIGNIDATLCLERPKIAGHIPAMLESLCGVLEIPASDLSIKATTNEKMGYVGREEGVTAYAVALLLKKA